MEHDARKRRLRIAAAAAADLALTLALRAAGLDLLFAHILGFGAGFGLGPSGSGRVGRETAAGLLTLVLRGLFLEVLVDRLKVPPAYAVATAVVFTAVSIALARALLARTDPPARDDAWPGAAAAAVLASIALRLLLMVAMDLLPEEAYYFAYGEHPALGYLDHPPMVGWLCRLSTGILGHHEAAVRMPALLCWAAGTWCVFSMTRDLFGRAAAIGAVVLCASLPFFFSAGLILTPDAPLFACWAGTLLCLSRALRTGNGGWWVGVGVCLGLGMLSKYTIALLVPATVLFCILDPGSRRWFCRPHPYLALLIAAALFSPVVVWNLQNDWASMTFQGARRWSASGSFSLHSLLGSVLVVLTPTGLIAAAVVLRARPLPLSAGEPPFRYLRFAAACALVPLSVFAVFSLTHAPKLNWTGPLWLAVVPGIAAGMTGRIRIFGPRLAKAWPVTIAASLILLGGGAWFIVRGLPGAPPISWMAVPSAWRELVRGVDDLSAEIRAETGAEPVRAGLDLYFLAAEVSFYSEDRRGETVTGRHITGRDSLMWERWSPAGPLVGRTMLLLARNRRDLEKAPLPDLFERLSEVRELPIRRHGKIVLHLPWRVGYGYRGPP